MGTCADWLRGPFLGFDTETTGVDPQEDRLVTAALVEWRDRKTKVKTWLANPGVPIPQAAQKVHGISDEKAQSEGADLEQVVLEVSHYLVAAAKSRVPIVIYNAAFDLPLLEAHLRRFGHPTVSEQAGFVPVIDPLVIDRAMDRYRRGGRKLIDLVGHYGIDVDRDNLHDALVDVETTIAVLRRILEVYPELGEKSLEELFEAQREWYRDWATHINAYWSNKGLDKRTSVEWL